MNPVISEVLRRRLATQRLSGPRLQHAVDVVRLLACPQSQECAHAFWSLGMRTSGLGYADVQAEFGALLAAEGLVASRFRLAYVIMNAELEGLICSGPMRGAQQTYALLDERAPEAGSRTGDLGELAWRFYAGHGPASVRDLARWATLTQSQAGGATEAADDRLERVDVHGVPHWFDPAAGEVAGADRALLLPVYDEATLSYPGVNFPRAEPYPAGGPSGAVSRSRRRRRGEHRQLAAGAARQECHRGCGGRGGQVRPRPTVGDRSRRGAGSVPGQAAGADHPLSAGSTGLTCG
jgi:Winged helix DNA-binding domain